MDIIWTLNEKGEVVAQEGLGQPPTQPREVLKARLQRFDERRKNMPMLVKQAQGRMTGSGFFSARGIRPA